MTNDCIATPALPFDEEDFPTLNVKAAVKDIPRFGISKGYLYYEWVHDYTLYISAKNPSNHFMPDPRLYNPYANLHDEKMTKVYNFDRVRGVFRSPTLLPGGNNEYEFIDKRINCSRLAAALLPLSVAGFGNLIFNDVYLVARVIEKLHKMEAEGKPLSCKDFKDMNPFFKFLPKPYTKPGSNARVENYQNPIIGATADEINGAQVALFREHRENKRLAIKEKNRRRKARELVKKRALREKAAELEAFAIEAEARHSVLTNFDALTTHRPKTIEEKAAEEEAKLF